ncbi:MAG: hypothetical protein QX203_17080 [Methylococcaceae bacterium]
MTKSSLTNVRKRDMDFARSLSEKELLRKFEYFFLFEFYVRYLKNSPNKAFDKLMELKESIRRRFIELQVIDWLAKYTFSFEELPEQRYPLEINLEDLVGWTLNAIQTSDCQLVRLCSDLSSVQLSKEHLDQLFTPFKEHKDSIEPALKEVYYQFSHLTSPNDVSFVLDWWLQNIDESFRREQKLLGKLGLASVEKNDWSGGNNNEDVVCLSFSPFTAPRVLFFEKTNYKLYSSNQVEVIMDGQQLANSVVLSIQFDQDSGNMDEILRQFVSRFYARQAGFFLDALDSRTNPGFLPRDKSKLVSSITEEPNDGYRLITRSDSISKWLFALVYYDAYKHRYRNENHESVTNGILMKNQSIKLPDADTLIKYYYELEKKINNIHELFRKKYPLEAARFYVE